MLELYVFAELDCLGCVGCIQRTLNDFDGGNVYKNHSYVPTLFCLNFQNFNLNYRKNNILPSNTNKANSTRY